MVSDAARSLEAALRARVARASARAGDVKADLVFDAGRDGAWTVRFKRGATTLEKGRVWSPTSTIVADARTLQSVVEGRTSGVQAFLDNRLSLRGNIALPLELDDLLHGNARDPRAPRVRRVLAEGVRTFYLEAGPAHGPPVLLLHGLGATSASFLPTLHDLAADHRVIAIDLPGFGESDKPVRPLRPAFFARHVVALLDALGIPRAHLVGNSMGGRIALEVALRTPDRVGRLVLLCPSMAWRRFRFATGLVKLLRHELGVLPIPMVRGVALLVLRSLFAHPERVPPAGIAAAADEFTRVFGSARGRVAFFNAAREIYLEEPHGDRGFWERLPRLSRPALFLFGERDLLVPRAFSRFVEEAVPAARVEIFDDCGHVPQYEMPDRTNALVREFFREDA